MDQPKPAVSAEMLRMIEEKRQKAIELRKRKLAEQQQQGQVHGAVGAPNNKVPCTNFTQIKSHSTYFNPQISRPNPTPIVSTSSNNRTVFVSPPKINYHPPQASVNTVPSSSRPTPTITSSNLKAAPAASHQLFSQNKPENFRPNQTNYASNSPTKPALANKSNNSSSSVKEEVKICIGLESGVRFTVLVKYITEIINIFKQVESRKWDPETKKWSFSLREHGEIIGKLRTLKQFHLKFDNPLSENVVKALVEIEEKKKAVDLSERLEDKFLEALYNYQREGIIFGVQRDGKCLIADDMGLGKTMQAIGLARWYEKDWPLIIVCPASLRYQWEKALHEWIPTLPTQDIYVVANTRDMIPKVRITIISYDLLSKMKTRFTVDANRYFGMIILDESHYIKSDVTQRTSTAMLIAKSCKRVVLLSGTPALSRPMELFPQLNMIQPDLFPSKHGFGLRYCNAQQRTIFKNKKPIAVWDYRGNKNLDELRIILESTLMIRRLKKDVLGELPSKKREMITLVTDEMNDKTRNKMNRCKNDIVRGKKSDRNTTLFEWFNLSAEAKLPAVKEYLKDILDNRDLKMLCFCHHKLMMDGIEEMLNQNKINHIRIDGSTPPKVRQEACDVFQTNDRFRIALLSLTACATGLNLTAASLVVFTEVYWNPGVLAQAEDRVHRIGQQTNVRAIYLVARGTIDEMIWPLISKKLDILNQAGLSRDTFDGPGTNALEVPEDQQFMTEFINILAREEAEVAN